MEDHKINHDSMHSMWTILFCYLLTLMWERAVVQQLLLFSSIQLDFFINKNYIVVFFFCLFVASPHTARLSIPTVFSHPMLPKYFKTILFLLADLETIKTGKEHQWVFQPVLPGECKMFRDSITYLLVLQQLLE